MSTYTTHDNGMIEVIDLAEYRALNANADVMTCWQCGRSWDDAIMTGVTPVPGGRCPFGESDEPSALQSEIDYWDGFGVQTEWFIKSDGMSALGIMGDADKGQIISIDVFPDGDVRVQHTGPVQFSTGGPEI